jgi:hypothetical protein
MRAAIAGKPDEAFPKGNEPKKELDVPLTPQGSPVVKEIPKPAEETDPDAIPPDIDAGPKPLSAAPAPTGAAP